MRLARVSCAGVRGVPDGDYAFSPPGSDDPFDFVLIHGPSASGKTRLLDAIVAAKELIAPSGMDFDQRAFVAPGGGTARMEVVWVFEEDDSPVRFHDAVVESEVVFGVAPEPPGALSFELSVYEHGPDAPKLEYFHAQRRIVEVPAVGLHPDVHKPLRGSKNPRKYAFVGALLRRLGAEQRAFFTERLARLGATCGLDPEGALRGERPFRSRRGDPIGLADLSSSDEEAVLLAATATLVGLDRSIVLIDRPEMFLPLDEARLPEALCALGRGAQVIAASSHPRLARALPQEQVVRMPETR